MIQRDSSQLNSSQSITSTENDDSDDGDGRHHKRLTSKGYQGRLMQRQQTQKRNTDLDHMGKKESLDIRWQSLINLLKTNKYDMNVDKMVPKDIRNSETSFQDAVNKCFLHAKQLLLKSDKEAMKQVEQMIRKIEKALDEERVNYNIDDIKTDIYEIQQSSSEATKNRHALQTMLESGSKIQFKDFRWHLQAYSLVASFYNAINLHQRCESVYVRYIELVEEFYGKGSLETSTAYFLIGVYYHEQNINHKAIACFRKSLAIRETKFGPLHKSCADCLLNLGILYKFRGLSAQSRVHLERALKIKQECVGVASLAAAMVHEELGKFFLEEENFNESYLQLKTCYEIRRKIYMSKNVADVERAFYLLVFLLRKIEI